MQYTSTTLHETLCQTCSLSNESHWILTLLETPCGSPFGKATNPRIPPARICFFSDRQKSNASLEILPQISWFQTEFKDDMRWMTSVSYTMDKLRMPEPVGMTSKVRQHIILSNLANSGVCILLDFRRICILTCRKTSSSENGCCLLVLATTWRKWRHIQAKQLDMDIARHSCLELNKASCAMQKPQVLRLAAVETFACQILWDVLYFLRHPQVQHMFCPRILANVDWCESRTCAAKCQVQLATG